MEIIVGKKSGFCAGVRNTITQAEKELENNANGLDCLGEIIHNKQVIESLNKKGLHIIDSIEQAKNKVIIRAHGISKQVYTYAKENNIKLIDLTCPKVLLIHKQVQEFAENNYFIFLLGVKDHPETIGTYSFCGDNSYVIENTDDISNALNALNSSNLKNVLIISQTTFSVSLFEKIVDMISNALDESFNLHIEKSICDATNLRQAEANEISKKADLMIIIGGQNSSNTKKLVDVSKNNCKNVLHIQTIDDLNLDFVKKFDKIGIMAGASTPSDIIEEVVSTLQSI